MLPNSPPKVMSTPSSNPSKKPLLPIPQKVSPPLSSLLVVDIAQWIPKVSCSGCIKVVPERIYSMAIHPQTNPLRVDSPSFFAYGSGRRGRQRRENRVLELACIIWSIHTPRPGRRQTGHFGPGNVVGVSDFEWVETWKGNKKQTRDEAVFPERWNEFILLFIW